MCGSRCIVGITEPHGMGHEFEMTGVGILVFHGWLYRRAVIRSGLLSVMNQAAVACGAKFDSWQVWIDGWQTGA